MPLSCSVVVLSILLTFLEKYNTLRINDQTIKYEIKVQALKDTS